MNAWTKSCALSALAFFVLQGKADPAISPACIEKVRATTQVQEVSLGMKAETDLLYLRSLSDAYHLSMPLLVAGYTDQDGLYALTDYFMSRELKKLDEEASYTDWLRGRLLWADLAKHGKVTRQDILIPLQRHVEFANKADSYMAWAAAYLAGVDYRYKDKMLTFANAFNEEAKAPVADKIWVWVLVMQAAANAQDKGTYLRSMDQINRLAGEDHLSKSLLKVDYPAWALSIARLSTAIVGDYAYFHALEPAFVQALSTVEEGSPANYQALAEKLLAQSNDLLAQEKLKQAEECMGGTLVPPFRAASLDETLLEAIHSAEEEDSHPHLAKAKMKLRAKL